MKKSLARAVFVASFALILATRTQGEGPPDDGSVTVGLGEAATEAAERSPAAREARLQWLIRQSQERGAWGDFEPALVAHTGQSSQDRENTAAQRLSQLGRAQYSEDKTDYSLGLEGRFFTGAGYRAGYTLSKTESDIIAGAEYESNLGLSLDQPLLKGATRQAPLAAVRIARLDSLVAFHTYRKQLISVVSSVESAYWDLALAQQVARIADDSVRIAQQIAQDARERVSLGKLSELDSSEAELQLDIRLAEQKRYSLAVSEAAAQLRLLLGDGPLGSSAAVRAADDPGWDDAGAERIRAEAQSQLADALLFQPDVAMRRAELEKERIQLDLQRDQRLPELNASARLGYQGLGDSASASLQKMSDQEFPTWSLSLELRLPIMGDVRGTSAVEVEKLKMELAASQVAAAERETTIMVEALIQRVLTYLEQAESARAVSGFKRQLLDVEMERFDAGKSDLRRVYDAEQALSDARTLELEGYGRLRKASVDLSAASGTALRGKGLETIEGGQVFLAPALVQGSGG